VVKQLAGIRIVELVADKMRWSGFGSSVNLDQLPTMENIFNLIPQQEDSTVHSFK
jgi:hypothetical protein